MTARRLRALAAVALVALLSLSALPLPALAAEASATTTSASAVAAPVDAFEVQLWPGGAPGKVVTIVGVTLPDSVKLPALVRVPAPAGAELLWAGEIAGTTSTAGDIQREAKLVGAGDALVAEFTVTDSRVVQVEYVTGDITSAADGTFSTAVRWVQSVPSSATEFSVRVPSGATDVAVAPTPAGEPQTNDAGEMLYSAEPRQLKAGEAVDVSVSYRIGGGAGSTAGNNSTPLIIGLVVAALVVGAILLVRLQKRPHEG